MNEEHLITDTGEAIPLSITKEKRIKRLRMMIDQSGVVQVKVPLLASHAHVLRFIHSERQWIQKSLARMRRQKQKHKNSIILKGSRAEYLATRVQAESIVFAHLSALSISYRSQIMKIRVGNQRSRWGSCSRRGSLRFNYRIIYLPHVVQRYLVAHEVAHIVHMNHSELFWQEVARLFPEYETGRLVLRQYRIVVR